MTRIKPHSSGGISGSRASTEPSGLGASGFDPGRIAQNMSAAERKALMHREGASEACMSWDVARSLYDRGLTLQNARFLRLTLLGASVRAALQRATSLDD